MESAFHKAGEEIAGHGKGRDQNSYAARNEVATTDALREYQNVVSAIESVPPQERVKCALENELWNRRRLNLRSVGGGEPY